MMSDNKTIPCEVIRDLFPSYIDGLTNEVTNREIEAHNAGCADCAAILASMKNPQVEPAAGEPASAKKEIDFLLKNKRRNLKIILGSLAGAVAVALAILGLRLFVIGDPLYGDWIAYHVQVSGSDIVLDGSPVDSAHGISKVTFEEVDGGVYAYTRAVLASPLHPGEFRAHYTAQGAVRQIYLNNRVIWAEGVTISSYVSSLYETRHEYMGSMSDNARTADALNLSAYIGHYTNELQTGQRPYAWIIKLSEPVHEKQLKTIESDMNSLGYVLLGLIGNLDEVTFDYTMNGSHITHTVTTEVASQYFGQDIKDCGQNVRVLHSLIQKTGLDATLYPTPTETYGAEEAEAEQQTTLRVVNSSEEEWQSISCAVYRSGEIASSQGAMHADGTLIKRYESTVFNLVPQDFGNVGLNGSEYEWEAAFDVETADGKTHSIVQRVRISPQASTSGTIEIVGNSKDGFRLKG